MHFKLTLMCMWNLVFSIHRVIEVLLFRALSPIASDSLLDIASLQSCETLTFLCEVRFITSSPRMSSKAYAPSHLSILSLNTKTGFPIRLLCILVTFPHFLYIKQPNSWRKIILRFPKVLSSKQMLVEVLKMCVRLTKVGDLSAHREQEVCVLASTGQLSNLWWLPQQVEVLLLIQDRDPLVERI